MQQSAFSKALTKLEKFNEFVLKDKKLRALFVDGEYDFLQAYQVFFFSYLTGLYGAEGWGSTDNVRESKAGAKIRLRQVVAVLWSAFSYIWLILSRRQVIIFGPDRDTSSTYYCDFRASNLYRGLQEKKIKFIEFFHTIFDINFISRAIYRHRPALYLEPLDTLYKLCEKLKLVSSNKLPPLDINAGEETELFRTLISTYAPYIDRSRFKIRLLRRLLSLTNVQTAIGSEDMRYYQELYVACETLGIKSYAFLGGTISKYYVEYISHGETGTRVIKPSFLIVESNFWKNELKRWGTYFAPEEIIIGGNIKADHNFISPDAKAKKAEETITVLVPYETIAPKDEILKYIEKLSSHPEVIVIFKFRGDRDLTTQAREYGLPDSHQDNLKLITNLSEIKDFDIVLGTYSTFLYEMIGKLKPVVILKTGLDWGEGLVINKLVDEISIDELNLSEKLKEIKNISTPDLLKRRQILFGETIPLRETLDLILK